MNSQLGEFFKTIVDVRQGCLLSPIPFNLFLEKIIQETLHDHHAFISTDSMAITHSAPLIEGPYATYDLPTTKVLWAAAVVNFKTSPTDS